MNYQLPIYGYSKLELYTDQGMVEKLNKIRKQYRSQLGEEREHSIKVRPPHEEASEPHESRNQFDAEQFSRDRYLDTQKINSVS